MALIKRCIFILKIRDTLEELGGTTIWTTRVYFVSYYRHSSAAFCSISSEELTKVLENMVGAFENDKIKLILLHGVYALAIYQMAGTG